DPVRDELVQVLNNTPHLDALIITADDGCDEYSNSALQQITLSELSELSIPSLSLDTLLSFPSLTALTTWCGPDDTPPSTASAAEYFDLLTTQAHDTLTTLTIPFNLFPPTDTSPPFRPTLEHFTALQRLTLDIQRRSSAQDASPSALPSLPPSQPSLEIRRGSDTHTYIFDSPSDILGIFPRNLCRLIADAYVFSADALVALVSDADQIPTLNVLDVDRAARDWERGEKGRRTSDGQLTINALRRACPERSDEQPDLPVDEEERVPSDGEYDRTASDLAAVSLNEAASPDLLPVPPEIVLDILFCPLLRPRDLAACATASRALLPLAREVLHYVLYRSVYLGIDRIVVTPDDKPSTTRYFKSPRCSNKWSTLVQHFHLRAFVREVTFNFEEEYPPLQHLVLSYKDIGRQALECFSWITSGCVDTLTTLAIPYDFYVPDPAQFTPFGRFRDPSSTFRPQISHLAALHTLILSAPIDVLNPSPTEPPFLPPWPPSLRNLAIHTLPPNDDDTVDALPWLYDRAAGRTFPPTLRRLTLDRRSSSPATCSSSSATEWSSRTSSGST
ncbi:hypothetical protein JCM8097_005219, partial [Rhodosporidiobolus ruineniae]